MTLVAGLSFGGMPAFIGDLLVSSRLAREVNLPTRQSSELLKGKDGYFANDLAQKLLIVRPYILIAWAGTVKVVHDLAQELNEILPETIDDFYGREDDLLGRLDKLPSTVEIVTCIIRHDAVWPICVHTRGFEIDGVRLYLLGTGNEVSFDFLTEMTRHMPKPDNSDGIAARSILINFAANALMAQFQSAVGFSDSWGGGFEIAYPTPHGFKKVDNILVRCWSINADGSLGTIGRSFLIHYHQSALFISSFGDGERTAVVESPLAQISTLPTKTVVPEWIVDLFYRVEDGLRFHAVQMQYPWSKVVAKLEIEDGVIVGWNMKKSRVKKIIEMVKRRGPFPPFQLKHL